MNNKKQRLGVAILHLKDKYAYASTNGNEMSEFKFDTAQMNALLNFLYNGVSEEMFSLVEFGDYEHILNLNYLSLARETSSSKKIEELENEFDKKDAELKKAYEIQSSLKNQSQPE